MQTRLSMHWSHAQVLLLDSDNLPLANPEALFDTQEYRQHGALFFPDWCARTTFLFRAPQMHARLLLCCSRLLLCCKVLECLHEH